VSKASSYTDVACCYTCIGTLSSETTATTFAQIFRVAEPQIQIVRTFCWHDEVILWEIVFCSRRNHIYDVPRRGKGQICLMSVN